MNERDEKRAQDFRKAILKAIDDAPTIKGVTIKYVASRFNVPAPTVYVGMEKLLAEGVLGSTTVGKTKIYLKKRR